MSHDSNDQDGHSASCGGHSASCGLLIERKLSSQLLLIVSFTLSIIKLPIIVFFFF